MKVRETDELNKNHPNKKEYHSIIFLLQLNERLSFVANIY